MFISFSHGIFFISITLIIGIELTITQHFRYS
jgi:hypothetical protein